MNLTDLKQKSVPELMQIAQEMNLEYVSRTRKQDIIFAVLKAHAKKAKIFLAMVFLKFYKTVLDFYDPQTVLI